MATERSSSLFGGYDHPISLDEHLRASITTLELVESCASNNVVAALSPAEKESLHSSLNKATRIVESIKEKLSMNDDSRRTTSTGPKKCEYRKNSDDLTSMSPPIPEDRQTTKPKSPINENNDAAEPTPKPTPCLRTAATAEGSNSPNSEKGEDTLRQRSRTGFFAKKQSPTIHPQNNDIETGNWKMRARSIRFSNAQTNPTKESQQGNLIFAATQSFQIIDENGDGFLQKEEVIRAIEMMVEQGSMTLDGETATELATKMMSEVDTDGNGQIDLEEFTEMMRNASRRSGANSSDVAYNHRMSQLAKNVLRAHQQKLESNIVGQDMWLIHPLSNSHATWDVLVSLLILLTVITMPLSLGWEELNEYFFGMNLAVDFIFLLDVCKNFCTGFVDENEAIIMDAVRVRRNYVTSFFVTDFCSSIPLDLILKSLAVGTVTETVAGTKQSLKMLKLIRLTKLFRLLRINRLFQQLKRVVILIEETLQLRISDGFTKLMRLGVGALVLAHWIGCFNFMLVRLHNFPPDSWVAYAGLQDERPFLQWSWSFFKALAQMIMIGFETPPFTNGSCDTATYWCSIENWITLGCLYLGAIFYSLLISSVSSILQTTNQASRQFDAHLLRIDDYMRTKKLPASMREKVKEYFYLQYSDGKLHKEDEVLDFLSPVLLREIKHFTGRDICRKVPLLSNPSRRDFAEEISCVIEATIVFEDEVIIREQTTGEEMFFIHSGLVEIFVSSLQCQSIVFIGDGCYFGDVSILLGIRRTASAKSKTQCVLYRLKKRDLLSLLNDHPAIESRMMNIAQSRRRRLQHIMDPNDIILEEIDEVDDEDRKTELFDEDANKLSHDKEEEFAIERINSGLKPKRRKLHQTGSDRRTAWINQSSLKRN